MLCSLSTYRVVRLTSLGTKAFKQTVVRLETFLFQFNAIQELCVVHS